MYDYCPSVIHNLHKAQRIWAHLLMIMVQDGTYSQTLGRLYLSILQAIPFVLETWLFTPCIRRVLEGFHKRVELWIMSKEPQKLSAGSVCCPPLGGGGGQEGGGTVVDGYLYLQAP